VSASVTALGKRPCPECGGEMEWNAAKQAIACPYCGLVSRDQPSKAADAGAIVERDLEDALSSAGGRRGFGTPTIQVKCQSCHAISVFEPTRVAQRCDFCASPSVVPYEDIREPVTPESLLPVRLDEPRVREAIKQWVASLWFAPNALKSKALTDTLKPVYLPFWTFDARAHADWTAMSGKYYYTTQRYTDSKGRSRTRQVRHTRWYPSSGQLDHFFDDDLVPGTAGVRMDLLRKVEPFPTKELKPYDPAYVRGWTVERYQVDLRKASETNHQQMDEQLTALCARQVPGDTHKDLRVASQYSARTFKHILAPVWLVTYRFGTKNFQTVVNGYTGAIAGDRPISWVKVFFYIVLPALVILVLIALSQAQSV
jgi:hypothetical protein